MVRNQHIHFFIILKNMDMEKYGEEWLIQLKTKLYMDIKS